MPALPLQFELFTSASSFISRADLGALGSQLVHAWSRRVEPALALLDRLTIQHMAGLSSVTVNEAVALVASALEADETMQPESYRKYMVDIARLAQRLNLEGVAHLSGITADHVSAFVDEAVPDGNTWSAPAPKTMQFRLSATRRFLREARRLSLIEHDPTLDLVVASGARVPIRPLTDDEEATGRIASRQTLFGTRLSAAWALGQACATQSEMAAIRPAHVDLDRRQVWLAGNAKRSPRRGQLTRWGTEQLEARMSALDPSDAPVVYSGGAGARGCNAINEVFVLAGLAGQPGVRPASLAAWAGRRLFDDTGDIAAVARALGVRLDRAAEIIGWDWR